MLSRLTMEIVTALGTGTAGAVAMIGGAQLGRGWTDHGPEAGYFPFWVGGILVFASLCNAGNAIWRRQSDSGREVFLTREQASRLGRFLVPMVGFVILTVLMGTYVGTTAYLALVAWWQGGVRPWKAIGLGVVFSLVLYVVFEMIFLVPLHKGPIEHALGIY